MDELAALVYQSLLRPFDKPAKSAAKWQHRTGEDCLGPGSCLVSAVGLIYSCFVIYLDVLGNSAEHSRNLALS